MKDDIIMHIPDDCMLTFDVVSDTPLGKKMLDKNIERFGDKYFFAAYILTELGKDPQKRDARFRTMIDLFPTNFDQFPLCFSEEDLRFLDGSPIKEMLNTLK